MNPAILQQLAIGALIPGAVGLIFFLSVWLSRRGTPEASSFESTLRVATQLGERPWIAPLVFGAIAAIGVPTLIGAVEFPPRRAFDWTPIVALAAMLLGLLAPNGVAGGVRLKAPVRWALRAGLVLAVAYVSSRSLLKSWGPANAAVWIGGFTILTLASFWGVERVLNRTRDWSGPAIVMIWAGAAGQVLIVTLDSLRQGQVATMMAAVAGAAMIAAIIRPRFTLAYGGVHVPVIVTAMSVFQAAIFKDDLPTVWWAQAGLLLASAVLPTLIRTGPRGESGLSREIVRVALAAVPAMAAVGIAVATMAK